MSLAFKFTTLFLKTLSKPIANGLKAQAQEHAAFRKLCISFAQTVHRTDVNLRRRLLNEKQIKVRPLNDAKAIQSGANFLADSFVFGVGGAIILFEYYRSARKAAAQRATIADDIKVLQDQISFLEAKLLQKKVLTADEVDYTVPDDFEPSVLKLRHKNGKITGDDGKQPTKDARADKAQATKIAAADASAVTGAPKPKDPE